VESKEGELEFWPGVNIPRFLAATAVSTFVEYTATYPCEVIKTRLQVSSSKQGFFSAFRATGRTVIRELGWRKGLYRGLCFTGVTSFPISLLYIGSYNSSLAALVRLHEKEGSMLGAYVPKAVLPAAASTMAEVLSAIAWVPQDQVSNRLMLGENPPGGGQTIFRRDSASRAVIRHIYDRRGVSGFYRGFGASIAAYVPAGMIWWVVYEESKRSLEENTAGRVRNWGAVGLGGVTVSHAVSGAVAGIIASTLTNPFDIAKTRIQTGRLCYGGTTAISVLRKAISHEGLAMLSKGLFGRVAIAVPTSIFQGSCYEAIMAFCQGEAE
jgi:hypothetical protein